MSASSFDSSASSGAGRPAGTPVGTPVRSAAVVNGEIRALWTRAGGALSAAEQERYQRLLVEWAAAVRADVVEAA
ncbi:hypothetical protein [Streptomyces sp. SID3212]|uniref:hypothetical protein n=1 Tax=Streptomyces sp. SID3212 TaxID=2690259 RepID=UPI0013C86B77|nr:hypothetical protein [Streptomyces sp. SID3212]MYV55330.1 hypothetical protein [Streptomyces sp. SID3212]